MKLNKSQDGFSLVEGLLVVIALALVVFVGFYVYDSTSDEPASKASSAKHKESTSQKSTDEAEYLTIKDLGIKIPLSSALKDLDYDNSQAQDDMVGISTKQFEQAVADCRSSDTASASFAAVGSITKISGQYDSNAPPQDFYSEFAKQFPGFYLTYGTGDGGITLLCTDSASQAQKDKVRQIFDEVSPAIKAAVKDALQA
jgi:hypothetical protein